MTNIAVTRRRLLAAGVSPLPEQRACRDRQVPALGGQNLTTEGSSVSGTLAWEKKDLGAFNMLLADNSPFRARLATTTSAKSTFKNAMLGHAD